MYSLNILYCGAPQVNILFQEFLHISTEKQVKNAYKEYIFFAVHSLWSRFPLFSICVHSIWLIHSRALDLLSYKTFP